MTLGRKPITIVEIDIDFCTLTYGTGACAAVLGTTGASKCFNTFRTCQDTDNYDAGIKTLRFCHNQEGVPRDQLVFPALKSVSTRPSEVNLSGIDPRTSAMGRRARVSVVLQDFTWQDTYTDKYQAERISGAAQSDAIGYDPKSRGTFFGRLVARWPYYLGRPLRIRHGYVGDALVDMDTAHYVVSEWSGPNAAGTVEITAKDVLDLADNEKAVAPSPTAGQLLADINQSQTTLTLTPEGIGSTYSASGRVNIGREVAKFTRVDDVMTLTERGVDGSSASNHRAGDTVQECLRFEKALPNEVVESLLVDFAGVDPAFIDTAEWAAQASRWMTGLRLTATITKPIGVSGLIGEIAQLGVLIWWDEVAQEIRFQPNRPRMPGETNLVISDDASFIEGTVDNDMNEDQRISSLYFYHGMIDLTGSAVDAANYSRLALTTDVSASSANEHGQHAIKEIFSRWFGEQGDDAAAASFSERMLARYRNTPRVITATLDAKDRGTIGIGTVVDVQTRLIQDATGARQTEQMQVKFVEISDDRLKIAAETYAIDGRFGYIMADGAPNYSAANAAQKLRGCFLVDATLQFPDGSGPYVLF